MAMAFAPLAITLGKVTIDDPGVVSKSYPGYWNDLEKAGFGIIQA
jgi:3-phosphoshikimate 1-carboxyvinyltransferase